MRTAVIIAHGDLEPTPEIEGLVRRADLIVAADGGAAAALARGWPVHLLVGDLDSAAPQVRAQVERQGGRIVQYSPRKDETDTELALRAALEHGAAEVYLLGATGDRLDHSLANILLLAMADLAGLHVTILAGRQRLFAVREQGEVHGRPGDLVSLLPVGGDAIGIHTTGLEYPLRGETLRLGLPRGISNVLTAPCATLRLAAGILLVIHTPR